MTGFLSSLQQANVESPGQDLAQGRLEAFCQRAILACILFILVWAPLALGSTGPAAFLVIQGVTALAVALWAVRWWVQRPFRLCWPPVCWAVLVFLLYALLRCQLVDISYIGRDQLMHVVVYVALFFVTLNNLNRKDSANIVAMTMVIVGFCLAFFAVVQFVKGTANIWGTAKPGQYLARGSGTFINPNSFAAYLEMIVPLALAYTVMGRFSATIKVVLAYAVLAMLAGIVVSLSRGGILAMIATLVLFCLILLAQKDFWLPALITLSVLLIVGFIFAGQFDSLQRRFAQAFESEKVNTNSRDYYWQAAEKLYARNVIWGIGPGHFGVQFPSVRPPEVQNRPDLVHNDYLNTLCEWGAVGMGIVAAFCGLLAWVAIQAWFSVRKSAGDLSSKRSDRKAFILGASIGLIAIMLHCIVDFNMQIPADAITAILLMALIAAQARFVSERYWKNPGFVGKIILTVLAGGAVSYFAAQGVRKGRETFWLRRAETENVPWQQTVLFLKNAHEIDPSNEETDYLLGEELRVISKDANPGYEDEAKEAIQWFAKGMKIDPYDARLPLRIGMSLDWIGHAKGASPYFALAERSDTNNYYIALEMGRHYVSLGEYDKAKEWVERSLHIAATPEASVTWGLIMKNKDDPLILPHK
ncbi:MAG TPA: O-antigen ligase family protein [Verrucomicrobiae bacterium]|nr:O-antigen ligase family protein [Verrucomicrobiae bacterium]